MIPGKVPSLPASEKAPHNGCFWLGGREGNMGGVEDFEGDQETTSGTSWEVTYFLIISH